MYYSVTYIDLKFPDTIQQSTFQVTERYPLLYAITEYVNQNKLILSLALSGARLSDVIS